MRDGIGHADHRQGTRVMLAVERRKPSEATRRRVIGVVEPEPEVEGVSGRERYVRVEAEDLVQQNGSDQDRLSSSAVGLKIGLIPGKPKARETEERDSVRI